jgi:molybdenum-dependent DNA-binding transcriptional regulator ModE
MSVDPKLREWATERQKTILDALDEHGTQRAAAEALGLSHGTVGDAVQAVKKKAAREGYAPGHWTGGVAAGYLTGKVTVEVNAKTGEVQRYWQRQHPDAVQMEAAMRATVDAMKEEVGPVAPTRPPVATDDKLLNLYPITDFHLGAKAWKEETGAAWDMEIAERLLIDWFAAAIAASPAAKYAVFANMGDFLHYDSLEAVTPTSKNVVDSDTRFQKMIRVNIRLKRCILSMLLQKHEHVYFIEGEGNHDLASSAWGRELFAALYENEPRIFVETRPDPYYAVEHGKTSLFFHHGHKKKRENLETAFIAKFREIFGRTQYSYGHCGHLHHDVVRETNTMHIEQHETLAAPDSHASRGAWLSKRSAKCITYHKEFGEVGRITISPEMVEAA